MLVFSKKKMIEEFMNQGKEIGREAETKETLDRAEAKGWPDKIDGMPVQLSTIALFDGQPLLVVVNKDGGLFLVAFEWCEERPDPPDAEILVNKIGEEARS